MQGLKFLYLHIRESTSLVHVVNNVDQMRQGRQYPICNLHLRSLELLFSISFFYLSQHRHGNTDGVGQVIICDSSRKWEKKHQ